jgi:hypothetical protein
MGLAARPASLARPGLAIGGATGQCVCPVRREAVSSAGHAVACNQQLPRLTARNSVPYQTPDKNLRKRTRESHISRVDRSSLRGPPVHMCSNGRLRRLDALSRGTFDVARFSSRPEGATTNQPRATPWEGRYAKAKTSPERAAQGRLQRPCFALSGLRSPSVSVTQGVALGWYVAALSGRQTQNCATSKSGTPDQSLSIA